MDELLTAKQLQELLKVDRTTIYRMINDRRISGVKVGQQWRFPQREVEALLAGGEPEAKKTLTVSTQALPLHCLQPIQNVFAEIAQVGAVTTAPDGTPLTEFSNSCRFCNLIRATESGRQACIASWRQLVHQPQPAPRFFTCHAGLQYARSRIQVRGELVATLIAGQFYADAPNAKEEATRLKQLAQAHKIERKELVAAARDLRTLDARKREELGNWLASVAHTFEQVADERAELMNRLERIAEMSKLNSTTV
jgi:excisionase family DNA binding protein